jgi:hypothetical protein
MHCLVSITLSKMQASGTTTGKELSMTQVVNCTPHPVNLFTENGEEMVVQPCGHVARCAMTTERVGSVAGVKVNISHFGEVTDLPEPADDTVYVVSAMVLAALHGSREDVFGLSEYVRDEQGRTVGARALTR